LSQNTVSKEKVVVVEFVMPKEPKATEQSHSFGN